MSGLFEPARGYCGLRRLAVAGQAALAQSGQAVRNIRVDVAPLRANAATRPRPGRTGASAPARASSGRPPDDERRHADGQDRLSDTWPEHRRHDPRRLVAGQHPGRGDDQRRAMAGQGDDELLGVARRPDDGRTVQSLPRIGARSGAGVLDRARPRWWLTPRLAGAVMAPPRSLGSLGS